MKKKESKESGRSWADTGQDNERVPDFQAAFLRKIEDVPEDFVGSVDFIRLKEQVGLPAPDKGGEADEIIGKLEAYVNQSRSPVSTQAKIIGIGMIILLYPDRNGPSKESYEKAYFFRVQYAFPVPDVLVQENSLTNLFSGDNRNKLSKEELKEAKRKFTAPNGNLDVRAIRESFAMSQSEFSREFRIPLEGLKKWEQGISKPTGAALVSLATIAVRPDAVRESIQLLKPKS